MFNVADWPGFNVIGKVIPVTEKPLPLAVAEFNVTADVPVEVMVMDWVAGVLITTSPNATLLEFTLIDAVPVFN